MKRRASNTVNTKKPVRFRGRSGKQVRKMRKSSLSRVQKNFSVFQQQSHENKYENLKSIGDGDEAANGSSVNGNTDKNIGSDIEEVAISEDDDLLEDDDEEEEQDRDADESEDENETAKDNSLVDNDDFIAFDLSEEEADDNAHVDESEEGTDSEKAVSGIVDDTLSHNSDYPWVLNHDHSKQREIADWLTLEIKDFVAYISPNRQEIEQRNEAIAKLKAAIEEFWPDASLHCFGSYATDLYLPGSDIDCVVRSTTGDKENRNALYSLASFLKRKELATQVEVIAKARVPIIKFVEPFSKIHIDVSFERTNGLEAARVIRGWLQEQPGLRELVLIVKQFLHARRLNDVHTGGLGGYSIICLVYTFLRLHPRVITGDIDPLENLGVLLIDFFELYGKNFGYDDVGISVKETEARYIPKEEHPDLVAGRPRFSLVIQDPGDASNNISRGSFNLRDIKKGFAGAFDLLTNRCFELDSATFKDRIGSSILGNVIKYKGSKRDFNDERALVVNEAIQENEKYHKKRGRIIHQDLFTDMSDLEAEEEIYDISQDPPTKKTKREKKKDKKDKEKSAMKIKEKKDKSKDEDQKKKKQKKPATVITIPDEDEDDYDPAEAVVIKSATEEEEEDDDYNPATVDDYMGLHHPSDDDNENHKNLSTQLNPAKANDDDDDDDDDDDSEFKMRTVDKQTKRDYWLSKGQTM